MGFEGSLRRLSLDVQNSEESGLSGGDLSTTVATANLMVRGSFGSIQPYGSFGVVLFSNNYEIDPETVELLAQANRLYRKFGFRPLRKPLGDTGHAAFTDRWYVLDL